MQKPKFNSGKSLLLLCLINGFCGALLGFFYAQYQWAVEPSQIISGIVKLPYSNPFYIISTKTWNIIHQFFALFLRFGVSERILSFFLSIFAGSLAFLALTTFSWALTNNFLISTFLPFFIFYLHGTAFPGPVYPLMILGNDSTYGMIGLSFCLLAVSLLSLRKFKPGWFLLGLSPAFHATQALWFNLVVFLVYLTNTQLKLKNLLKKKFSYIFGGYFISFLSLTYHFLIIYKVKAPKLNLQFLSPYCQAIINFWSDHYHRFSFFNGNGLRIIICLLLSLWVVKIYKRTSSQYFLSKTLIVSFFLALIFSFVYWLPNNKANFYFPLLILFPARLFNYHLLASFFLLTALFFRKSCSLKIILFFLIISFMVAVKIIFFDSSFSLSFPLSFPALMGLIIFLGSGILFFLEFKVKKSYFFSKKQKQFLKGYFLFFTFLIISLVFLDAFKTFSYNQKNYFLDASNDSFFNLISQRKGTIISGPGIFWLMLKTRRPVLLNGGMGIYNYAPEASLEAENILKKVYGIDFLNPPLEILNHGRELPPEKIKPLWETRTLKEWQIIKEEFNAMDVITQSDWQLNLPKIAENKEYILYTIP